MSLEELFPSSRIGARQTAFALHALDNDFGMTVLSSEISHSMYAEEALYHLPYNSKIALGQKQHPGHSIL